MAGWRLALLKYVAWRGASQASDAIQLQYLDSLFLSTVCPLLKMMLDFSGYSPFAAIMLPAAAAYGKIPSSDQ